MPTPNDYAQLSTQALQMMLRVQSDPDRDRLQDLRLVEHYLDMAGKLLKKIAEIAAAKEKAGGA